MAYAIAAWPLIQAASIFLPAFDAPPWAMKIFVVVLVLGFPAALVLSWAFEITPEGIRRESDIEAGPSITHRTGRKLGVPSRGTDAFGSPSDCRKAMMEMDKIDINALREAHRKTE